MTNVILRKYTDVLILAGVSISMLGGENGIITQAQQAKDRTRIEAIKEKIQYGK